jgi:tRNA pseudouridine32 synthase/23S rRNA pseudouridine746 synthase/23S rRNA pseudouridine1911/1915/1917 synthase
MTKNCLILEALNEHFPDSSLNTLRGWLKAGRVTVDGKRATKANAPLSTGASLEIGPRVHFLDNGIKVLYEDRSLIVLEKPEGVLSVATDFDVTSNLHTLLKRRQRGSRVFPVHRLDRETSGIMLFAYTQSAQKHLKKQFETRQVEKTYYALVEGQPPNARGTWESYLSEDAAYHVHSHTHPENGEQAITHYEIVKTHGKKTLLRLRPVTGKKHQLRVHCKEAGVPILGDPRYGTATSAKRLCLHAQKLCFIHPVTNKKMCFETPLPDLFSL